MRSFYLYAPLMRLSYHRKMPSQGKFFIDGLGMRLYRNIVLMVMVYGLPVSILLVPLGLYLVATRWWARVLALLYLAWFVYDRNSPFDGAVHYEWLARWLSPEGGIFSAAIDYFPVRVHPGEPDPLKARACVYAYHPHSILPFAPIVLSTSATLRLTPKTGTIRIHFRVPVWRELAMLCGFVDVGKRSLQAILHHPTDPQSVLICPGGAKEALMTFRRDGTIVPIRKAFIAFAMAAGVPVVPVWGEGELGMFAPLIPGYEPTGRAFWVVQKLFRRLTGMVVPLFRMCGPLGILPPARPIDVYVGKALDPRLFDSAEAFYDAYTDELRRLHTLSGHPGPFIVEHL